MSTFFYDKQIRRFVEQFIRYFSYFDVEYGQDSSGNKVLYRVPCRYADTNRTVSSIVKQNSENSLNNVPMLVVYIDNLEYDRERLQNPKFVDKKSFRTTSANPYGNGVLEQSTPFTLERLMPAPYKLTVKVEFWTSNFEQKLQLFEQICPQFNPDMEIQNTDNFLDWTSLSYILLKEINWTTRNIPVGTDEPIDIGAMTFELPIWLTVPSKLKKLGVVTKVITSLYDAQGNLSEAMYSEAALMGNRQYFTPQGYQLILINGILTLAAKNGPVTDTLNGTVSLTNNIDWHYVISLFGQIVNGASLMYLTDPLTDKLIVGSISYDPMDPYKLLFDVDPATIPTNTLSPFNSIIDPMKKGPGAGLPAAALGQRYLILSDIGSVNNTDANSASAWQGVNRTLIANSNDIIEYTNGGWVVVFDSKNIKTPEYCTNLTTNIQYKWTGTQWQKSYEGLYPEGFWSILI